MENFIFVQNADMFSSLLCDIRNSKYSKRSGLATPCETFYAT